MFDRFQHTLTKFYEYRTKLAELKTIDQQDVDGLLHPAKSNNPAEKDMPKGIDVITLEKIINVMKSVNDEGISAENVGKEVGVSRTTARRYLEYLVSGGMIGADLSYGTVGRPERIYVKKK
jgi:response regulator of citrate/malate metabolism